MDPDFGPFPDRESALNWLEERGSYVKDSWIVKTFTPKEVARRVLVQRLKDSKIVQVRGFDNNLPDSDIEKAIANHFSSCGEIVEAQLCPSHVSKSYPDRYVRISIIGEDVKEKAEQLNGSELGGCKLVVLFQQPSGVSLADLLQGRKRLHRRHFKISGLLFNPKAVEARKALQEKERNQQLALEEKARLEEERKQFVQSRM